MLRNVIAVVASLVGFSTTAIAQTGYFTGNTVFMAIQCDVGRFAATAKKEKLDPAMRAKVSYAWSFEDMRNTGFSFGAVIPGILKGPNVSAARQWTQTDERSIEGEFNIHEANTAACQKKNAAVPVQITSCLKDQINVLKSGTAKASCAKTIVYGVTRAASGAIQFYIFEAGPQYSYSGKITYKIKIEAPSPPEKKRDARERVSSKSH